MSVEEPAKQPNLSHVKETAAEARNIVRAALKGSLDAWFDEVRKARWKNTAVKRSYATVDRAESTFDVTEMCCVELGT